MNSINGTNLFSRNSKQSKSTHKTITENHHICFNKWIENKIKFKQQKQQQQQKEWNNLLTINIAN